MSALLTQIGYKLDRFWHYWCSLLRHETPLWDPYGAAVSLLVLLLFVGLTVKFIRD